jgi:hypothetical protein
MVVAAMDLATELQKIYDSEINIEISWLWDGGLEVRLGDRMNGYRAETTLRAVADIVGWLQEAIAYFYPDSSYAKGLPREVRERAARQIFLPPSTGARVTCPQCGAPNANQSRMEEIICFICSRCGAAVEVKPPRVQ